MEAKRTRNEENAIVCTEWWRIREIESKRLKRKRKKMRKKLHHQLIVDSERQRQRRWLKQANVIATWLGNLNFVFPNSFPSHKHIAISLSIVFIVTGMFFILYTSYSVHFHQTCISFPCSNWFTTQISVVENA